MNRDSGSSLCQLPNSISSSHGKQADSTSSLLSLQNYGIPSLDPPGFASQCSVSNYASIPNEQTPTIIDSEVQSGSDVPSFTPPLSTRPSRDLTTESSSHRRASVPQSTPYQNFQFGLYESNQGTDLNRLTNESRASTYVSSRSAMTMTLETEKATSVPYTQRNLNAYSSNSLNYLSNSVNIYPPGSDSAGPGPSTLAYHMSNLPSSRTLTEQTPSSSQLGAQTTELPSLTPAEALSNSPIVHASSKKASQTTPTAKTKDRKRNHPCWMCHKSFDRPSTLRKVSWLLLLCRIFSRWLQSLYNLSADFLGLIISFDLYSFQLYILMFRKPWEHVRMHIPKFYLMPTVLSHSHLRSAPPQASLEL